MFLYKLKPLLHFHFLFLNVTSFERMSISFVKRDWDKLIYCSEMNVKTWPENVCVPLISLYLEKTGMLSSALC